MKLISEEILNVDFLTEETDGKKSHFIEGIFLQAEVKNRNGRMYPVKTLAREVAKYDESYIQTDDDEGTQRTDDEDMEWQESIKRWVNR